MAVRRDGRVRLCSEFLVAVIPFLLFYNQIYLPGSFKNYQRSHLSSIESFASLVWRYFKLTIASEPNRRNCIYNHHSTTTRSVRKFNNFNGFVTGLLLLCGDISTQPGPINRSPSTSRRSTLNCFVSNARSLKSTHKINDRYVCNLSQFQDLVYTEDADIAFVSETWLNSDVFNKEILPNEYSIIRKDRGSRGGGVLLAIKTNSFKSVKEFDLGTDIEACSVEVTTHSNLKLFLCCCYRPPNSDKIWLEKFNLLLSQICDCYENMLICGDINFPNISWDHPERTKGTDELQFIDLLGDYFLSQIVTSPTRGNNVLDLVLTSVPDLVELDSILQPEEAGLSTDHCTVTFSLKTSAKLPHKPNRTVYDYRRGDFPGLRSALQSLNLSNILQDGVDINLDWHRWKDTYLSAVADFIPSKKVKGKNSPPWITGNILHYLRKKETARKKLKSSPSDLLREKFKQLRTKTKQMIRESRAAFFDSLDIIHQPKRFWSIFRLTNKSSSFPEAMSMENQNVAIEGQAKQRISASTPRTIAELFNSYFSSVFSSTPIDMPPEVFTIASGPILSDLEIPTDAVLESLKQLDINKASGPDGIPARLLKETADEIAPSLTQLFNKSLKHGMLPDDWKLANIVPVFKKGKKEFVENYRPISLLPLISKVLERCVLMGVKDHLYRFVNAAQHGFLPGKSCVTQLLSVLDQVGQQLDAGKQIDIIYLDMSKAFDKVNHALLLCKLRHFNITGCLHDWFRAYLSNRKQRVTVLGTSSKELPVTSGVPQGSLLGPLLFLLFVNDLPDASTSSEVACFADDTKIYRTVESVNDAKTLQSDLTSLAVWSESSDLQFNKQKCKLQRVTRKRDPVHFAYSIQGSVLEVTTEEKDLGVWISSDLTWSKQVHSQCSKANKLLGFVRRSSRHIKNISTRRALYLALVRSHLGYATQVWAPQSIELIKCVERVQRRATKYILKLPFQSDTSYSDRLNQCNLLPLTYWHELMDLVFFFKANNGLVRMDKNVLPPLKPTGRVTRSTHNKDISNFVQKKSKTVTYQRSFFIRVSRVWNTLPASIRHKSLTLETFKNQLFNYYKHASIYFYVSDNPRTWKSICIKCNTGHSLDHPLTCCF